MDDIVFLFTILDLTLCIYSSEQFVISENPTVKRYIHENRLLQDGYESFELTTLQFSKDLTALHSEIKRHKRSTENSTTHYASLTSFGQTFTFELKQSKLFSQTSKFVLRNGSHVQDWPSNLDPGCFLYGKMTSHHGSVSLHFCDGITGVFKANGSSYRIDTIGDSIIEQNKTLISKLNEGHTESRGFGCGYLNGFSWESTDKQRFKRSTTPASITIETALYVDAYTTNKLYNSGLTTTEQKVKALLIKWNGVQAEYSKSDQLGHDVKIEIKLIEFWTTNPEWLVVGTSYLGDTLSSFTNGIKSNSDSLPYDLHFLYTKDSDPVKDGYAWQGSLCNSNNFAVADLGSLFSFSLSTHEVGHTLGMTHDGTGTGENGCVSPDNGLMVANGGKGYDWSSCNKNELESFLQSYPSCLFEQNIISDEVAQDLRSVTLSSYWPGIEYSKDELCEHKAGMGFKFRAFPYDWGVCDIHSCIDMNAGISYGHMVNFNPNAYGTYCGVGMMCMNSYCKPAADSGLPASVLAVVEGGWGDWSSFTECSRTCGTGLRIRTRKCDSPRPRNSECVGLNFDAEKCNTEACDGDSNVRATLITQRATETCKWLLDTGMLKSDEYTQTGTVYWNSRIGQCEVWCNPVEGFNYPQYVRHGLMPDGTPCTQDTYTMTYAEAKGFPRSRGFSGHCVLGYCEAFDCDGKPGGNIYDGCGICGGNETTCTIHEGVYTSVVASGERSVIASLPVGAYRIQFYINYNSMQEHYLELWSVDDDALLAPYITWDWDTTATPKKAAGTDWSYLFYDQYLYAYGPITEPVVIKLHNYGNNSNTGVSYGYSLPLEKEPTTTSTASDLPTTTTTSQRTNSVTSNALPSSTHAESTSSSIPTATTTSATSSTTVSPTTTSTTIQTTTFTSTTKAKTLANSTPNPTYETTPNTTTTTTPTEKYTTTPTKMTTSDSSLTTLANTIQNETQTAELTSQMATQITTSTQMTATTRKTAITSLTSIIKPSVASTTMVSTTTTDATVTATTTKPTSTSMSTTSATSPLRISTSTRTISTATKLQTILPTITTTLAPSSTPTTSQKTHITTPPPLTTTTPTTPTSTATKTTTFTNTVTSTTKPMTSATSPTTPTLKATVQTLDSRPTKTAKLAMSTVTSTSTSTATSTTTSRTTLLTTTQSTTIITPIPTSTKIATASTKPLTTSSAVSTTTPTTEASIRTTTSATEPLTKSTIVTSAVASTLTPFANSPSASTATLSTRKTTITPISKTTSIITPTADSITTSTFTTLPTNTSTSTPAATSSSIPTNHTTPTLLPPSSLMPITTSSSVNMSSPITYNTSSSFASTLTATSTEKSSFYTTTSETVPSSTDWTFTSDLPTISSTFSDTVTQSSTEFIIKTSPDSTTIQTFVSKETESRVFTESSSSVASSSKESSKDSTPYATTQTTKEETYITSVPSTAQSTSLLTTFSSLSSTSPLAESSTTSRRRTRNPYCPGGSLQCYDGKCISYRNICDGIQDCPENEDETSYIDCLLYGRGSAAGLQLSLVPLVIPVIISSTQHR